MEETAATNAERVLTHEREVKLADGKRILVKPWGYATGKRLVKRLSGMAALWMYVRSGSTSLGELVADSYDEIGGIIMDSIGFSEDEMNALLLEDVLELASAVIDLNFLQRPQLVKALEGLLERAGALVDQMWPDEAPVIEDQELETIHSEERISSVSPSSS